MFMLSSIFFAWVYVKARDRNQDQARPRSARRRAARRSAFAAHRPGRSHAPRLATPH